MSRFLAGMLTVCLAGIGVAGAVAAQAGDGPINLLPATPSEAPAPLHQLPPVKKKKILPKKTSLWPAKTPATAATTPNKDEIFRPMPKDIPFVYQAGAGDILPNGFVGWLPESQEKPVSVADVLQRMNALVLVDDPAAKEVSLQPGEGAGMPANLDGQSVLANYYAGLITEDPRQPGLPDIDIGTVSWLEPNDGLRLDTFKISASAGASARLVAEIHIPDAKLQVKLWACCAKTIGAQSDPYLVFDVQPVAGSDPIKAVGAPVLRVRGNQSGDVLRAQITAQSDRVYQISIPTADLEHDLRLIFGRPWIDIPLEFASGKKSTLTFTTGKVGPDLFERYFSS